MKSIDLLTLLEAIPLQRKHESYALSDVIQISEEVRSGLYDIELSVGIEATVATIFDARNVPDDLQEAFRKAFTNVSQETSLYEHYQDILDRGSESLTGFISNLKGKLVELRLPNMLQEEFPDFEFSISDNPIQPIWDILAIPSDGGEPILIQAKIGNTDYADEVLDRMEQSPDVIFAVSNEIREKILSLRPDLQNQLANIDISNYYFTLEVKENLKKLADNFGIDVPDQIGEIIPFVSEIVLGIRFLCDVIAVERDYQTVQLDDRKRIHGMKALTLFSRFGVSAVCTYTAGAAGSFVVPPFGNIAGALAGALLASHLNKKLSPRILNIGMWLVKVNEDDLFYFQNKEHIDNIGLSIWGNARMINATA